MYFGTSAICPLVNPCSKFSKPRHNYQQDCSKAHNSIINRVEFKECFELEITRQIHCECHCPEIGL